MEATLAVMIEGIENHSDQVRNFNIRIKIIYK